MPLNKFRGLEELLELVSVSMFTGFVLILITLFTFILTGFIVSYLLFGFGGLFVFCIIIAFLGYKIWSMLK